MKIPFDIKFRPQIESGEYKVETKNGERVEILKWELRSINNLYPILAVVSDKKFDETIRYSDKGYCGRADYSLFLITPEQELSEFEKGCIRLYQDGRDDGLSGYNLSDENLKECSSELLALARKELVKEGTSKNEMGTMLYDAGFEDGKEEALKDLPRWRKWGNGAAGNSDGHPIALVSGAGGIRFVSVLGVTGEKYIMLDDLKKLPGFKED